MRRHAVTLGLAAGLFAGGPHAIDTALASESVTPSFTLSCSETDPDDCTVFDRFGNPAEEGVPPGISNPKAVIVGEEEGTQSSLGWCWVFVNGRWYKVPC
jgi:hypothetical protein